MPEQAPDPYSGSRKVFDYPDVVLKPAIRMYRQKMRLIELADRHRR